MNNSIKTAIRNIESFGDTDIFPYSFERQIFHDRPDLLEKMLMELHRNFDAHLTQHSPDNINTLTPVGYTGFRWSTQIDPFWNAYYLALVVELGDAIERARIPVADRTVFSYRFITPTADGHIFDENVNWHEFMRTSNEFAEQFPVVVVCDIADFYARIYHPRVENALKRLETKSETVRRIVDLLGAFSGNVSYGLPVGGPASRLLAELVLNSVDKLLHREGIRFCRFVDDYRLFCNSKEQAYERLIFLSEKLFDEGLTLQKNKTRLLGAKEFANEVAILLRSEQITEENLTDEDRLSRISIRFDPYSETRVDDYEQLKEQISTIDIVGILTRELEKTRIDPVITKQALSALRVLDGGARKQVLSMVLQSHNLQTLAPVFPRLMTVLRTIYTDLDAEEQELIDQSLMRLIESGSYIIKVELNLAYLLQVLRRRSTQQKEAVFVELFKSHTAALIRREVILAMASWGHNHWLADLKKHFDSLSKWERRAFVVASHYLTDEGEDWRENNLASFSPGEVAVRDWIAARFQLDKAVPT